MEIPNREVNEILTIPKSVEMCHPQIILQWKICFNPRSVVFNVIKISSSNLFVYQ